MINIVIPSKFKKLVAKDRLAQALKMTLLETSIAPESVGLTLAIEDNLTIQSLNRQFRDIDSVTDVLSFPANEVDPDTNICYLGDIIISYEQAKLQAETGNHPLQEELMLLAIHGALHLLGYDHIQDDEKVKMWSIQDKLLKKLECAIRSP
ncbi:MAG: rRNA maturation RNase YbeY [Anaerolineae bacterium]|nr:rRNA maturation RNase YbeY [Anaerolineae bacterium]